MKRFINYPLLSCILLLFLNCSEEQSGYSTPEQGLRFYDHISIERKARTYLLNLPPNYYESRNFPLVIALHGTGGDAYQFENDYGFTKTANDNQFVVVYPEGVRSDGILGVRTWNAGTCCDYAMENNIDDVEFIKELIDRLESKYKIDSKRIYVTGMSNGGMLTYRLACELSDKFAAIAVVSGTMLTNQSCNPSRPVPVLHIHSTLDTKVPPLGGIGIWGYYFPPVDSVLNVWSLADACEMNPQIVEDNSGYSLTEWSNCENDFVIQYYLTKDGGHAWPGSSKVRSMADEPSKAINANEIICNFFQQYELP
ncbi:extracellular catalytic domain type 1 short-chain-length polyhydroxyalkanoate depolymerase [Maribellus maritimus]|uniref:extracellular catalytic domain type 1 short-chain-length polyhydroxyalkanoate depolymerase n=1 Tax=Maribellus maritimus TaxID=2870838 RepID=UPI001EEB50FD|nr:PHB depolymerase family esterase [Maribellus maritimus]MCG6191178.1 prolyl oligopeptidase family serine peptidase [Maribellus maritimus]